MFFLLKILQICKKIILLKNKKIIRKMVYKTLKYNLKNNDLYYLCLRYLNINDKQISSLLGLTYSAVRKKRNKMKDIVVDLVKLTM